MIWQWSVPVYNQATGKHIDLWEQVVGNDAVVDDDHEWVTGGPERRRLPDNPRLRVKKASKAGRQRTMGTLHTR